MVIDLYWGISLCDINIDLIETIEDINEMAKLGNTGVKWVNTYNFSDKHKNFGFENFEDESKVNKENGIDLLLNTLSKTASSIFNYPQKEYCKKYSVAYKNFPFYFFTRLEEKGSDIENYDNPSNQNNNISFKYFINDNFSGGEIYFPYFNVTVKPKAGQLLIHPANYIYKYIEKPIFNGIKYQLNA